MEVPRDVAAGSVVELEEPDAAVVVPMQRPALLQHLVERLTREVVDVGDAAVLIKVQPRDRVARDVRDVDGVELDPVAIPVGRVLLELQVRAVNPTRDQERSVVEQILGVRGITPVTA